MRPNHKTFTEQTKMGHKRYWPLRFLLLGGVILLYSAAGFAGSANGNPQHSNRQHSNLAPDLPSLPQNLNGNVDVIIQFAPGATLDAHVARMLGLGAQHLNPLGVIHGGLFRIPASLL